MPARAERIDRYSAICTECGTEDNPVMIIHRVDGDVATNFMHEHDRAFHGGVSTATYQVETSVYNVNCLECHPSGPSLNDDPVEATEAVALRNHHNVFHHGKEDPNFPLAG